MYILIIDVYHLNLTQRRDYFETQKQNLFRSPLFLDDWNFWYNYPTVISANAGPVTIPVPGGGFTWDNTITNW